MQRHNISCPVYEGCLAQQPTYVAVMSSAPAHGLSYVTKAGIGGWFGFTKA